MPRNTANAGRRREGEANASMRPGQNAPEYAATGGRTGRGDPASMRPGQNAPEYLPIAAMIAREISELQ